MKSIYQEAIEDLYYVIPVGYPKDMIGKTIQTKRLLDFVKHAQKQEKLLNKIKEIIDRQDDSYISSMFEESQKYYEIKKLIKELEK